MPIDIRDFEQGMRESLTSAYQRGALDMKAAYDSILNVSTYDAKELFGVHNETMAAKMLRDMAAADVMEAKEKVDQWIKEAKNGYGVGDVVQDPLGNVCVITHIWTNDSTNLCSMYDVLYADGSTNRWDAKTQFEVIDEIPYYLESVLDELRQQPREEDDDDEEAVTGCADCSDGYTIERVPRTGWES